MEETGTTSWIIRYLEYVLEQTGKTLEGIAVGQNFDFKWDKGAEITWN